MVNRRDVRIVYVEGVEEVELVLEQTQQNTVSTRRAGKRGQGRSRTDPADLIDLS